MGSRDDERILSVAALGRPFRLGMLYDIRADMLIPGITLWDKAATLKETRVQVLQTSDLHTLSSDSLDNKASALEIGGPLMLSCLSGLVDVGGAAKFLHNERSFNPEQCITYQYKCTTREESLTMEQLAEGKVQHPKVFDHGTATHVVTSVVYGAQAFFSFGKKHSSLDTRQKSAGNFHDVIANILNIKMNGEDELDMSEEERKESEQLTCRYFGDFQCSQNVLPFLDAVKLYKKLPKLLGPEGDNAVPVKVGLYPLTLIDRKATRLVREISVSLVSEVQSFFQEMLDINIKCNDILQSSVAQIFPGLRSQMDKFKKITELCKKRIQKELCETLPGIRGGGDEKRCLVEGIRKVNQSPVSIQNLRSWLQKKNSQIKVLNKYISALAGMKFATEADDLDTEVMDPENTSLLCLTIYVPSNASQLETMKRCCLEEQLPSSCVKAKHTATAQQANSRPMMEVVSWFRDFHNANKGKEGISFLVALELSECDGFHAQVKCYRYGTLTSNDYGLPSPPEKVKALDEHTTHNSVTISWSPPKYGTSAVTSYVVSCCKAATEHVISQVTVDRNENQVTIPGLAANTEYEVRVCCRCGEVKEDGPVGDAKVTVKTKPASQPSPEKVEALPEYTTHNSVTICWSPPRRGASAITSYIVSCKVATKDAISKLTVDGSMTQITIKGLAANTEYEMRVWSKCSEVEVGPVSDAKVMVKTNPASQPEMLQAQKVSPTVFLLQWQAPAFMAHGCSVVMYIVKQETKDGHWAKKLRTAPDVLSCQVEVFPKTVSSFRVAAYCGTDGFSCDSEPCTIDGTQPNICESLKEHICANSRVIPDDPQIYVPELREVSSNSKDMIDKYEFGKRKFNVAEKVIMLVGATGSGKTTLINGFVNFIFGVQWEDPFRFKMILEPNVGNQAMSQTTKITSYTLHHQEGFRVPYTVTIVDTPGFGDVSGIMRDREITENIRKFFTTRGGNGISHIDAVGFVANSSLPRLTPTQRYIFEQILSLFGKDIADNIFLLLTFADGKTPQVLSGIKEAKIPFKTYCKFNNSALYALHDGERTSKGNDSHQQGYGSFDRMFWEMGIESFILFLKQLESGESRSLILTQDVLNERNRIQTYVSGIQRDIKEGLCTLERYKKEKDILQNHHAEIERNKDYEYEVEEETCVQVEIPVGQHITNCLKCNRTCHEVCMIADDDDKARCWAMKNGKCRICQRNCVWSVHKNMRYKIETRVVKTKKTVDELLQRYQEANKKKLSTENVIEKINDEFEALQVKVLAMTDFVRKSIQRLEEIALRRNPMTTVQYLEILMETEKSQVLPGWQARLQQLNMIKKEAECMEEIAHHGYDPFKQYLDKYELKVGKSKSGVVAKTITYIKKILYDT